MRYELTFWHDRDNYQAAIFSDSWIRGTDIWRAINGRYWLMPQGWTGTEFDAWMLLGLVRHEREACARCAEGFGMYNPITGWTILPINYAAFGLQPPDKSTVRRSSSLARAEAEQREGNGRMLIGDNWHIW